MMVKKKEKKIQQQPQEEGEQDRPANHYLRV
jgi:hypothetical protein